MDKTMQEKDEQLDSQLDFIPVDRRFESLDDLRRLYNISFPDNERKPFEMILEGIDLGKQECFAVMKESRLAGLAFTILGNELNVLDYLAVAPEMRSEGIGGKILSFMRAKYNVPFVVEIEDTRIFPAEDKDRRKSFYLRNGMQENGTGLKLFGVPMELLISDGKPDFAVYYSVMEQYFGSDISDKIVPSSEIIR